MKLFVISFFYIFSSVSLMAHPLPQDKEVFCSRYSDTEAIKALSNDPENLINFKNDGGLFNGGVCWWHAKFQRHLFYLSIFKPYEPVPSPQKIMSIIHNIRLGREVVTIPGYFSVKDFTTQNQQSIQRELEAWQIFDGVILSQWIDGINGKTKVRPSVLKEKMDELYQYVEVKKKVAYQKLQIKGLTSHAWLVVSVKPMPSGYDLEVLDSNYPGEPQIYSYKYGDDSFYIKAYGNFVPYLEYTREETRILNVGKSFCELTI